MNYRINMLICEYVNMLICLFHALYRCAIGKASDDKSLGVVAHLLTIGIVAASDGVVDRVGDDALHGCVDSDVESVGSRFREFLVVEVDEEFLGFIIIICQDYVSTKIIEREVNVVSHGQLVHGEVILVFVG